MSSYGGVTITVGVWFLVKRMISYQIKKRRDDRNTKICQIFLNEITEAHEHRKTILLYEIIDKQYLSEIKLHDCTQSHEIQSRTCKLYVFLWKNLVSSLPCISKERNSCKFCSSDLAKTQFMCVRLRKETRLL